MSMEMNFLRSARCSRLEKTGNNVTREKKNITNSVLDYIRCEHLKRYFLMRRMNEERLHQKLLEWCPPGRRR